MSPRKLYTRFADEHGAATIVEYTIVLPIVMVVICILIFTGYILYDRATLEAAAERTALYMCKTISDQNYTDITVRDAGSNEIESISIDADSFETAPYRFLFGNASDTAHALEGEARTMIRESQLLRNDSVDVRVTTRSGVFYTVTVDITEEFDIPGLLPSIELPPLVTIQTRAVMYVNEPAEFIRNADFAIELVKRVDNALGISAKVNEVVSQISFFKGKTS